MATGHIRSPKLDQLNNTRKIRIDLQIRRGQGYPKSKSIKKGKISKKAKKEAFVSVLAFQALSDRSLDTGSLISY